MADALPLYDATPLLWHPNTRDTKCKAVQDAGCYGLHHGREHSNAKILNLTDKNQQVRKCVFRVRPAFFRKLPENFKPGPKLASNNGFGILSPKP